MKTVVGLFDTHAHAEMAAHDLEKAGISHEDISLVADNSTEQFGPPDAISTPTMQDADAETEAGKGAVIGGVAGLLLGLAALAIPGLGAVAAVGWLIPTVAGAVVGAGIGVAGALTGAGVPHEDAAYYNEGIRRGGTLLAVRAQDNQATQVAQILSAAGAVNIDERASQYREEGFVTPGPYILETPLAAPPAPVDVAAVTQPIPSPAVSATEPALNAGTAPEPAVLENNIALGDKTMLPAADEGLPDAEQKAEHSSASVFPHTDAIPGEEFVEAQKQQSDLPTSKAGISATAYELKPRITTRAYDLYEQRGHRDGHALDDWLDAERELLSNA